MAVAIPITALKRYWPNEKIVSTEKVNAESLEYFTGLYVQKLAGFPV